MLIGVLEVTLAQEIQAPDKISISDEFYALRTHYFYEYELTLKDNYYSIEAITYTENGKDQKENKSWETIDKKLVEDVLLLIKQQPSKEIQVTDFQDLFTLDAINHFLQKEAYRYWITDKYQKEFIIEEFTNPEKLQNNLNSYFQNYDESDGVDGRFSEVKIYFHYADTVISVSSKSILSFGLPIEINGEKVYSPQLAKLMGELIPKSKTERNEQFEGKGLFSAVVRNTIINHRSELERLEAKSYQIYIDTLETTFTVSDAKVVNGKSSMNWSGDEKRLNCTLTHPSMGPNLSINYSTLIVDGKIKYPVSQIIADYRQLYSLVKSSTFFQGYLTGNKKGHLTIIYDDHSCITDQAKQYIIEKCKSLNNTDSLENAVFIKLEDESGSHSRWVLLPNGKYFSLANS